MGLYLYLIRCRSGSNSTREQQQQEDTNNNSIDDATLGLTPEDRKRFTKLSEDNALTVADYIVSMIYE